MKQKKKKGFKIFLTFLIIITILLFSYLIYNKYFKENSVYSDTVMKIAKDKNIDKEINKYEYSKTLEEMLLNNKFNEVYLYDYTEIDYLDKDNFLDNVNIFLKKGYKSNEINKIYNLSELNINKLLKLQYNNLDNYYDIKNFDADKIERYNNFKKNNADKKINDIVTYVNIGLDNPGYVKQAKVKKEHDITMLVNKYHYVDKDYIPKKLTSIKGFQNVKMVESAALAFNNFLKATKEANLTIEPTTAYRSYTWQNSLYTTYVSKDGKEKADTYSARPGYSEHQTGLAIDLNNPNYETSRLTDNDYKWILDNSYKYGFIVRYPKNGSTLTGYNEEPWHLRYLGIELATKVKESGLTYDEYYDLNIEVY